MTLYILFNSYSNAIFILLFSLSHSHSFIQKIKIKIKLSAILAPLWSLPFIRKCNKSKAHFLMKKSTIKNKWWKLCTIIYIYIYIKLRKRLWCKWAISLWILANNNHWFISINLYYFLLVHHNLLSYFILLFIIYCTLYQNNI